MLELLLLMSITQMGDPFIECPAGCYPHTNLDLWGTWYDVKNFDPTKDKLTINGNTLPVYTTASGLIDFKFIYRWLE